MNLKFLNTEEGSRSWHFWPQVWIPLTRVHSPKPIRILKVSGYLYIGWGMEGVSTVDFLQLCWLSCHHFENQDIAGNKYWKWWPAPIIPSEHKNDDQRLLYLLNTKMTKVIRCQKSISCFGICIQMDGRTFLGLSRFILLFRWNSGFRHLNLGISKLK